MWCKSKLNKLYKYLGYYNMGQNYYVLYWITCIATRSILYNIFVKHYEICWIVWAQAFLFLVHKWIKYKYNKLLYDNYFMTKNLMSTMAKYLSF